MICFWCFARKRGQKIVYTSKVMPLMTFQIFSCSEYPSLFLYAGLWNCWLFKDSLSSWPPGKGKECNIVFKITPLDPNFHECEWLWIFCPCFWNIKSDFFFLSTCDTNFVFSYTERKSESLLFSQIFCFFQCYRISL